MLSVPLSMTGALLALWLTGGTLNIYSQVGLVTLVGLITKHGILIVEFSNQLRAKGEPMLEAVVDAATLRLRPILMTTGAMVLGALPLALAHGRGRRIAHADRLGDRRRHVVRHAAHAVRRADRLHAARRAPARRRGRTASTPARAAPAAGDCRSPGMPTDATQRGRLTPAAATWPPLVAFEIESSRHKRQTARFRPSRGGTMKHSHFALRARSLRRSPLLGVATAAQAADRDPVVALDDRRAMNDRVNELAKRFNESQKRVQGRRRSTRAATPNRWPRRSPRSAPATRRTSCRCSRSAPRR